MNYLFFDLEYASTCNDSIKICEFGYVLTDEKFNLIERDNFVINPDIRHRDWDFYAVKKILTKTISEYERCPYFPKYYENIKKLILKSVVFGHSVNGDVKALNDEFVRYDLTPLDFDFYDVKLIHKEYKKIENGMSVVNILDDLGVKYEETIHNAETDAYNTMLILKELCRKTNLSVNELIETYPQCADKTSNLVIRSYDELEKKKIEEFEESIKNTESNDIKVYGENKKRFKEFTDNLRVTEKESSRLNGNVYNISINYTEHHFRQTLNLIQKIINNGGKFDLNLDNTNVFISYKTKECKSEPAGNYIKKLKNEGKNIDVTSLDDFLESLNMTADELDGMPMPSFDFLFEDGAVITDKKTKKLIDKIKQRNKKEESSGYTISEINFR